MLKNCNYFWNFSTWLFRRRAIIARNRKTCAVIKAEEKQPCSPFGFHCKYGLRCKQIPIVNETVGLQQLFFPTSNFNLHNQDYPQYQQYGPLFRGQKNRRKSHFNAHRVKRQPQNNQNEDYSYEYPQDQEAENEEPLDIGLNHLLLWWQISIKT